MGKLNEPIQRGLAAAQSIFDFLDAPTEPQPALPPVTLARGDIEFRDVRFSYPEQPVLERFNLSAQQIQDITQAAASEGKQPHLHPDQTVSLRLDAQRRPVQVQFFNDDDNGETQLVDLAYAGNRWQAKTDDVKTTTLSTLKSVIIRSSGTTAGAMSRAEIPAEVRDSLRELFSNRLDLYKLPSGRPRGRLYF